jgi:uncharacterized protein YeaO (DUF488 family)
VTGPRVDIVRAYDQAAAGRRRVLIDRLWPRGVSKERARIDEWMKDAAPSTELRRWYGHDPAKFAEFARRYCEELQRPPASDAVARLRELTDARAVSLVTATRDVEHSGARVLRDHLTGAETSTARRRSTRRSKDSR